MNLLELSTWRFRSHPSHPNLTVPRNYWLQPKKHQKLEENHLQPFIFFVGVCIFIWYIFNHHLSTFFLVWAKGKRESTLWFGSSPINRKIDHPNRFLSLPISSRRSTKALFFKNGKGDGFWRAVAQIASRTTQGVCTAYASSLLTLKNYT